MSENGNDSVANAMGQGPVTVIEHGGKEYDLAPLLMKDMGIIEQEAKAQHRREVLSVIKEAGDLLDSKEKAQWLKTLAKDLSGGVSQDDVDQGLWTWMDEMSSPALITFVITLRLRKTYPDMTQEEADSIVTVDAIAAVRGEMSSLLGLDAFVTRAEDGEATPGEAESV